MQKVFLLALLTFLYHTSMAQVKEGTVTRGVKLYDEGRYREALAAYQAVLSSYPDHEMALYESSLAYIKLEQYDSAVAMANRVIKGGKRLSDPAHIAKGSALDLSGKPREAINAYQKIWKRNKGNTSYLYNMALSYTNAQSYDSAAMYLSIGIMNNRQHAPSHVLLAYCMMEQNHWLDAILPLYHSLLIQPEGVQAAAALQSLDDIISYCVDSNLADYSVLDKNRKATTTVDDVAMVLMSMAKQRAVDSGLASLQTFYEITRVLFKAIGELRTPGENFWDETYMSYFHRVYKEGQLEPFIYHISRERNDPTVKQWIYANPERMKAFLDWSWTRRGGKT